MRPSSSTLLHFLMVGEIELFDVDGLGAGVQQQQECHRSYSQLISRTNKTIKIRHNISLFNNEYPRACNNPDSITSNNTYLNIVEILFSLNFFQFKEHQKKIY